MAAEHTLTEQKGHTTMHTYIYIHPLTKCQPSTPYGIQEKCPDKMVMVTITRSKVKSRSQNDVAPLQPITNSFQDMARYSKEKSLKIKVTTARVQGQFMVTP